MNKEIVFNQIDRFKEYLELFDLDFPNELPCTVIINLRLESDTKPIGEGLLFEKELSVYYV